MFKKDPLKSGSFLTKNKMKKKLKFSKNFFEKSAWKDGLYVCGIDEVGRGCLAGPVVISACILPINTKKSFKDSKLTTIHERELDFEWLNKNALHSTAIINSETIDRINIFNATLLGMKKAYAQILEQAEFDANLIKYLLIDAMPLKIETSLKNKILEIHNFPFGESVSTSIAAASIIAKVTRDRLMCKIDKIIPGFNFSQNKGYGTKDHIKKIRTNNISILHRKSFISGILNDESENKSQQSIF